MGQQVRMATPVQPVADGSAASSASGSPPVSSYPAPANTYPANPATPAPANNYVPPAAPAVVVPPPGAGGYSTPGAPIAAPPGSVAPNLPPMAPNYAIPPGTAAPPPAGPIGGVQPAPGAFDPYATPGACPQPLLPQDPYCPGAGPEFSMTLMQRFIQHIDLDFEWFAGNGDHELGIDNVGLGCTFAFPLLNVATPVLVTPGFTVHYWSGPVSVLGPPPPADLPPRTYDAYIDTAWNPWFDPGQTFGAELDFRIGMYSDFDVVTSTSLRYMGRAEGVLRLSDHMTIKAGVWYLDRLDVKLLPAGGLCWYPNDEFHFDILFPNPKVTKRLATWGTTEWSLYARGEYGGGSWNISRNSGLPALPLPFPPYVPAINGQPPGTLDRFDYNDIEIALGVEFKTIRQAVGDIEVGLSCDRQLVYQSGFPSNFYPNNTVFVGAKLAY
jgi:hypothetical protein